MKLAFLATLQSSCAGRVCSLQNFSGHHQLKFQARSLNSASRAVFGTDSLLQSCSLLNQLF